MDPESRTRQTVRRHETSRERGTKTGNSVFAARLFTFILSLLLTSGRQGVAQVFAQDLTPVQASPQTPRAQTTLAVFSDRKAHRMSDRQWDALVASLREELDSNSPEIQALIGKTAGTFDHAAVGSPGSQIQIIREDQLVPGLSVENPIAIFLHGECRIQPRPPSLFSDEIQVSGTLGWVKSDHSHIEPFIHVDCDRLGQMLATKAFGRNREQRDNLMAVAIARVILHEWIHIATQSKHHSDRGLAKARFGSGDLSAVTRPSALNRGGE